MEKTQVNKNIYELDNIFRKDGVFRTEDGRDIKFKNYYVEIRNINTGLIIRAKVDKVFNDYVEEENETYI